MYKLTTGGLGYYRGTPRGLGDLPGFPGADPQYLLTNIGEAVWQVFANLGYIMGAAADGSDLVDGGRAGRTAVENYFASQVGTADVVNGNYAKVNAAANSTAVHFLNLFGGQPRSATGVTPGDLQGTCLAYAVGPSSFYAAQTQTSTSFSPATKCAQLQALLRGSGLNWLQVAAGGDGLGNMPPPPSATPGVGPGYADSPSPYSFGGALFNGGGSGVSPVYQAPAQIQVSTDPVVSPVIQAYQPVTQPVQQAGYFQPLTATSPAAALSTGGTLAMTAPATASYAANVTYPQTAPASAGVTPPATAATAATSALGGITDWITANPLIAAGIAAGALFMFSQGGKR